VTTPGAGIYERYLSFGEVLCASADALAATANQEARARGYVLTRRDQVLSALLLKADGAFRALIRDALERRPEAMHHLKTMAEVFIYYRVVASDGSNRTAAMLVAEGLRARVLVMKKSRIPSPPGRRELFRAQEAALRAEVQPPPPDADIITDVERLARRHQLGDWYWTAYRLACEPAHVGDLDDYIAERGAEITTAARPQGTYRALLALHYGALIALRLFEEIEDTSLLGLRVSPPLQDLNRSFLGLSEQEANDGSPL